MWLKNEAKLQKVIFVITEEDVQSIAKRKLGRKLTEDELYKVKKGIEEGLMWIEVIEAAIDCLDC